MKSAAPRCHWTDSEVHTARLGCVRRAAVCLRDRGLRFRPRQVKKRSTRHEVAETEKRCCLSLHPLRKRALSARHTSFPPALSPPPSAPSCMCRPPLQSGVGRPGWLVLSQMEMKCTEAAVETCRTSAEPFFRAVAGETRVQLGACGRNRFPMELARPVRPRTGQRIRRQATSLISNLTSRASRTSPPSSQSAPALCIRMFGLGRSRALASALNATKVRAGFSLAPTRPVSSAQAR